jgi:hypothetical protein
MYLNQCKKARYKALFSENPLKIKTGVAVGGTANVGIKTRR